MGTLENIFVAFLLPVCICVLLPVLIMWLVSRIEMNRNNRRADVLIEAIKTYNGMDVDRLSEALVKPRRTPSNCLTCGCCADASSRWPELHLWSCAL